MSSLDLTVRVLNLSPNMTLPEICTFFSYCGTVEKIQLKKTGEGSQSAWITFKQPYAFQTALLLNEAVLAGQPIRVLPSRDGSIPQNIHKQQAQQLVETAQAAAITVASKGAELVDKTKDKLDRNYTKLLEKKQLLVDQTKSAIEQTAQEMRATITSTDYISAGTMWVSGLLDRASKWVYALGNSKRDNPNSRKQK